MPKALDPEVHATVKQAAAFLDRSRVTVMRRIATGALPSEKVRQRGAREIRAIKWEDLAEARYGSDHPPVMTDQQLVTEAAQTGEAVTAVMRPSGHWQTVGPGYAIGGQGD
ncbi:MAG TPA: hypothetical protein QGH10_14125, partial [Armatimonadota bacterium]|nr:hypothetical protein [Armatimonadota bacterium]